MFAQSATPGPSPAGCQVALKGLRSYDEREAEYFLKLLPGPRDLVGLPESVRFWKVRIEEREQGRAFPVGLVYGPAGSGKSSFVKAGLLPQLPVAVKTVYVDAAAGDTETRLLASLRRRVPSLSPSLGLMDALAALRTGPELDAESKLLIVLDHFEQWLRRSVDADKSELLQGLLQCDGGRLQCLLVVCDDAWAAASRFFQHLEMPLSTDCNGALIDGFDAAHARDVLTAFGRACGALPRADGRLNRGQSEFVDLAVTSLTEDGKVLPLRLALFAEMTKRRAWNSATSPPLKTMEDLVTAFLDAAFDADAPMSASLHKQAARRVLELLLPDGRSAASGNCSSTELRLASGYAADSREFDELMCLLEQDLQLIVPIESHAESSAGDSARQYRLSHDALIPALRTWLLRNRYRTRRGRAELLLAEHAGAWNAQPTRRKLPSLGQWLAIRTLTDKRHWTAPQQEMMAQAARRHAFRSAIAIATLIAIVVIGSRVRTWRNEAAANALVARLLTAETPALPSLIRDLGSIQPAGNAQLFRAYHDSSDSAPAKLHAGLALAAGNDAPLDYLGEQLLRVKPSQFGAVCELCADRKSQLTARLWAAVRDPSDSAANRFQAACALASYDAESANWKDERLARCVASHLVNVPPSDLVCWREALQPVRGALVAPLSAIYRDARRSATERLFAADTLANFLRDDPKGMFDLLADADAGQFQALYSQLSDHRERAIELAVAEIAKVAAEDADEIEQDFLARRQANAAVLLIRLDAIAPVRPLLKHGPDPRVSSFIVHWLAPRNAESQGIIDWYEQESDIEIQRALLLCLGEFSGEQLPAAQRALIMDDLLAAYRSAPDAGKRAAAGWLLKRWGEAAQLASIDQELRQNEERLRSGRREDLRWYVNSQGQTFVILNEERRPRMPSANVDHASSEHRYAIMATEVTKAQFSRFAPSFSHSESRRYPEPDCPIGGILWYEAAAYCNWLSEQEGVPRQEWCFEPNEEGEYGPGMKAKPNVLDLAGYRLPTEKEWESACRTGTTCGRYYGLSEELLPRYAWYKDNSGQVTWPVGYLKPNAFGLFDMHGGLFEWCHERTRTPGDAASALASAVTDGEPIMNDDRCVLRGGSFNSHALLLFSAHSTSGSPHVRSADLGFRVARTFPHGR